jgi:hypothetical protein
MKNTERTQKIDGSKRREHNAGTRPGLDARSPTALPVPGPALAVDNAKCYALQRGATEIAPKSEEWIWERYAQPMKNNEE